MKSFLCKVNGDKMTSDLRNQGIYSVSKSPSPVFKDKSKFYEVKTNFTEFTLGEKRAVDYYQKRHVQKMTHAVNYVSGIILYSDNNSSSIILSSYYLYQVIPAISAKSVIAVWYQKKNSKRGKIELGIDQGEIR